MVYIFITMFYCVSVPDRQSLFVFLQREESPNTAILRKKVGKVAGNSRRRQRQRCEQ